MIKSTCLYCGAIISEPRIEKGKIVSKFCPGTNHKTRWHNARKIKIEDVEAAISEALGILKKKGLVK
jgi:hypothetical protein